MLVCAHLDEGMREEWLAGAGPRRLSKGGWGMRCRWRKKECSDRAGARQPSNCHPACHSQLPKPPPAAFVLSLLV